MTFAGGMLLWKFSKQHALAMSFAESEFIPASFAPREFSWHRFLSRDWHIPLRPLLDPAQPFYLSNDQSKDNPLPINFDNQVSIILARIGRPTARTKLIDLVHCCLVAEVEQKRLSAVYIPTSQQQAHFLTKTLTRSKWLTNNALIH